MIYFLSMKTLCILWIYLFMFCLFDEGKCLQVATNGQDRYLFSRDVDKARQADSQSYCMERGGNLATILSASESDFLAEQARAFNQSSRPHYIGLQATRCNGVSDCRSKMSWIDGTTQAGYRNWVSDEPTEQCVAFLPDSGKIKGLGCNFDPQYFICKLPLAACDSFSCMNDGQCVENPSSLVASCTCPEGFTGVQCETDVNECESSPCSEGYRCRDMIASYRCDVSTSTTTSPATPGTDKFTSNNKTKMLWLGYPYWYFVAGGGGLLVLIICTAIITFCAIRRKRQAKRKSSKEEIVDCGNQEVDAEELYDVGSFEKGLPLPERPTQNAGENVYTPSCLAPGNKDTDQESAYGYSYEAESRLGRLDSIPNYTAPSPWSLIRTNQTALTLPCMMQPLCSFPLVTYTDESNGFDITMHDATPVPSSTDFIGKPDPPIPESPIDTTCKPAPPVPYSPTKTTGKPVSPIPMSESSYSKVKPALMPKAEPTGGDGNNQEDYMNIGEVGGSPKREVPEYISSSAVPERPPKPGKDIEADDQELYMNMVELDKEAPPESEAPIYDSFPKSPDRILEDDGDEQELYVNVEKVVRRAINEPVYDDSPESPECSNEPVYSPDSPERPECANAEEDEQNTYANVSRVDQRNTEDFFIDQGYNYDDAAADITITWQPTVTDNDNGL